MAQLNLGQVVPDIQITEATDGKTIKFTTVAQEVETKIKNGIDGVDGVDGVSPIATLSVTGDTLTVTIKDKEGTKTKTCAKGTTVYYRDTQPTNVTEVGTIWI